jgi:intergrase/recombinase
MIRILLRVAVLGVIAALLLVVLGQSGRVSAKIIRKWHLNMMIKEGITEGVADFIQGRAPTTVGSAHYLNKVQQATDQYRRVIGKFPV